VDIFLELLIGIVLISVTLSIPGNYLVLRGNTLTSYALSHSILFGIMVAYLIVGDLDSPLLLIGAALTGLFIVWVVENLSKLKYVNIDAALGLIYLFIFALGIILVSLYASGTTISVTSVVTGNIALIPFDRWSIYGIDMGPTLLWQTAIVFIASTGFLVIFRKEMKLVTFDPEFSILMGYNPSLFLLIFMSIVSIAIVTVFRAAGVILVVGLMIIPPASARLLSSSLTMMIVLSTVISVLSGVLGFIIAWRLQNVEIASMVIIVNAVLFIIAFFFQSTSQNATEKL